MSAHAVRGAFWAIAFSGLNKAVAFGSQIVLAWLLTPQEIGLAATALSVVGIATTFLGGHLQRVLVQRQEFFAEDAGQFFWLSVAMHSVLALALFVAATQIAKGLGEPAVAHLLWIVSLALPIMSLTTVYGARLSIDLRFRFLNACSFGEGIIRNIGSVLLAAAGCGASSILLPLPLSAAFAALTQRMGVSRVALQQPRLSKWGRLLKSGAWLMVNGFCSSLIGYGTNLILAAQDSTVVTGFYFWGASIASQAVFLLVTNLQGVFFPLFSKITRQDEQKRFFEGAVSVSVFLLWPLCLLQFLLAGPAIRLLFGERWLPAVPVVQWLSVGMLTQPLNVLGSALLTARGRFRLLARCTAVTALVTLAAAWTGAGLGDQKSVAFCVGVVTLLANCLPGLEAHRILAGTAFGIWSVCRASVLIGAATSAGMILLNGVLQGSEPVTRIILIATATLLVYAWLARRLVPGLFRTAARFVLYTLSGRAKAIGTAAPEIAS